MQQRRNRGGREGGRRRGPKCNFREMQGPYYNASITFKQCSNSDGPESKSVWFFKIYNFALGFICRRATVLKLK
jgi:hypothetical protein